MMSGNKLPSYDGVPTLEPELLVAVATPALEDKLSNGLPPAAGFFQDNDDIVAIFDYDREMLRRHQLDDCGVSIGMLFVVMSILSVPFLVGVKILICLAATFVGIGIAYCCGSYRTFLVHAVPPAPAQHTAVTTSGIRHVIEGSTSGGEHGQCNVLLSRRGLLTCCAREIHVKYSSRDSRDRSGDFLLCNYKS